MAVDDKTRILIWCRAANRCSICRVKLIHDLSTVGKSSLVGDVAHIVAQKEGGPRGKSLLTLKERDQYPNLILLCKKHHKIVDDDTDLYTVEKLHEIKKAHEDWVKSQIDEAERESLREIEAIADSIQEWVDKAGLDYWESCTYRLLSDGQPKMYVEDYQRFLSLRDWLFRRAWPNRYQELKAAFENFLRVLTDILSTFLERADKRDDLYITRKFYREQNHSDYHRLLREYNFHVDLVFDLTLELTRAANYVCEKIREDVDPTFRHCEGILIATSGPNERLGVTQHRVAYRGTERNQQPYPGLTKFKLIRKERDYHLGEGDSIDDPNHRCAGD